jgi:hypothetical protein
MMALRALKQYIRAHRGDGGMSEFLQALGGDGLRTITQTVLDGYSSALFGRDINSLQRDHRLVLLL